MTHWEPLLPTAQTWSEQASITTFKTQSKNLFFSIIIRTSKEKQFEMLAFIGRVAIKLAVNGGSLRWTFDSDAEQKWSLFRFFEKYYFQMLTTSETELMNIIITKENISIRKKTNFRFLNMHWTPTWWKGACNLEGSCGWGERREENLPWRKFKWDHQSKSETMKVDQVKLSQQDTNNEEKPIGCRITFKR